jgi:nucleoside-diphosphate-sugar epimerase
LFSVLDAARRWEVDRVCLASTIGVYAGAGAQPGPVNEDLPVPLLAGAALPIPTIKRRCRHRGRWLRGGFAERRDGRRGCTSIIGAVVGLTGAVIATAAFVFERRRRRGVKRQPLIRSSGAQSA